MRSFQEILTESKKTYNFKIGLAGELPEGMSDRLETALKRFNVVKMGAGKKTPIQERPLDFPNLQNTEVTYYEVDLEYPTTDGVLKEYLGHFCSLPPSHIMVRNAHDPLVVDPEKTTENEPYETLLTQETLKSTSAQQDVGQNRVMDLLKELEKEKKERSAASENGS